MNRPLRILSSDDDENIRALLFSLLTEHGHEVEFARNSDEVFKNLGRAKYDLLILDVNTPGMNGYKVAEKISTNISNRPRILIFTARDIKAEQFQFVSSGADAIVAKGAPCDEIMATIEGLFAQGADPGRSAPAPGTGQAGGAPATVEPGGLEKEMDARLSKELNDCQDRLTRMEDTINVKGLRYEEFIRDLLREKQRTEKNYLEFRRIENEVARLKVFFYITAGMALLAVLRSFF